MLLTWIISILITMIPSALICLSLSMSKKMKGNFEKSSPFECGFDPLSLSRPPFSIQFFLLSIMFLIFDTEIVLLIPLIIMTAKFSNLIIISAFFFLSLLIIGLLYEFLEKSLEWKI